MAKPLGYRTIDVDLTVAHTDERYPVGARRITVAHVDGEVYAKLNTPNAQAIRLAPGTLWTGSDLIEEVYITNDAGSGTLQLLVGEAVCADFSAPPASAAASAPDALEFRPYTGGFVWRNVRQAGELGDVAVASSGGTVSSDNLTDVGGNAIRLTAPANAALDQRYQGGFRWPLHPLFGFVSRGVAGYYDPPMQDVRYRVTIDAFVRATASGGFSGLMQTSSRARAVLGIGKTEISSSVLTLIGLGFFADPDLGVNWHARVSPGHGGRNVDLDDLAGLYYFDEDTGVRWDEPHTLSIEFGFEDGEPFAEWYIDGTLVASYTGYLDSADGAGYAAARNGTWGLSAFAYSDMAFSAGVFKRAADSTATASLYLAPARGLSFERVEG